MAINPRLRSMASEFLLYSQQLQFVFGSGAVTGQVLASIGRPSWKVNRVISVDSARAVIAVGPSGRPAAAVMKISRNRDAARIMERERKLLAAVRSDPRLGDLGAILPVEIAWGRIGEEAFSVETALPGVDARGMLSDPVRSARLQTTALEVAMSLHERTASTVVVDRSVTKRWVDEPLQRIASLRTSYPRITSHAAAIERLGEALTESLLGRRLVVSWVHGDFFPGNILVSPDGGMVTGLVDWDLAAPDDLSVLDVMQFVTGAHLLRERRELGEAVIGWLGADGLTSTEVQAIDASQARLGGQALNIREAVLLTWLRHVGSNLKKSAHFRTHRVWIRSNVECVLAALDVAVPVW